MSVSNSITSKFKQLKSHPRWIRMPLGILLVIGGIFGALPILGFWMLPLGLILLSADFPWAKRASVNLKIAWRRIRNHGRERFGKKSLSPIKNQTQPSPTIANDVNQTTSD